MGKGYLYITHKKIVHVCTCTLNMQIQVHNIVSFQLCEVPQAQAIPAPDIDSGTSSSECGILSPGYSELSSFQTSESDDVMDISVDSTSDPHDQSDKNRL